MKLNIRRQSNDSYVCNVWNTENHRIKADTLETIKRDLNTMFAQENLPYYACIDENYVCVQGHRDED